MDGGARTRTRWEYTIGGSMCLGYAALMLCRTTVGVAGPAMLLDADLHLTKATFGAILGWGTAGNLVGKLSNGILADRLGGRRVFLLALAITATAIGIFGTVSGLRAFFFFYFLTLFAKSAGWPAMANIIKEWFAAQKHGRVWGVISTSSRASSVGATLLLSSLLLIGSWRWLFVAAAAIAAAVVAVLLKTLKSTPEAAGLAPAARSEQDAPEHAPSHPLDGLETRAALAVFLKSARFWLICFSLMCLAVLFEFQVFIPIYFRESFDLSPAQAGMASSIFPAGCLVAVFAGGFIYDKLSKKALIVALSGMLGSSLLCLGLLWALPYLHLGPRLELALAAVAIFTFGFAIAPAYYLPMSVFSIDFGGKYCGLLIGLIDAIAYSGAMVFDFVGGAVADQEGGWQSFLLILCVVSVAATLAMSLFLTLDERAGRRARSG